MSDVRSAQQITRASKSNLALAFVALPKDRREDITTFYAFCRIVDDIADDPGPTVETRQTQLNAWKKAITTPGEAEPPLAPALRELIARRKIDPELFLEIIAGVEMDLHATRYATFGDLRLYCHRVASVVGLISIEIFGYQNPQTRNYALSLGIALQMTNIIRDVAIDYANGQRLYLPTGDLIHFGVTEADLAAKKYDERFVELMSFEAGRAQEFYGEAGRLLPPEDRRNMVAAEIMHTIYYRLLERMERDGFRVFNQRYALSKLEKMAIIFRALLRHRFSN
jgi:phytoene synthase